MLDSHESQRKERRLPWALLMPRMLGGVDMPYALLLFALSVLLCVHISHTVDMVPALTVFHSTSHVSGVVTDIRPTGLSTAPPGESARFVSSIYYRFTDIHGRERDGHFVTNADHLAIGQQVSVEYAAWFPVVSRLAGAPAVYSWKVGLAFWLFPLFSGMLVLRISLQRRQSLTLLRTGMTAIGILCEVSSSADSAVRGAQYYRLTFRYSTPEGFIGEATMETCNPPNSWMPYLTLSSSPCANPLLAEVLYDPCHPQDGVLLAEFTASHPAPAMWCKSPVSPSLG